MCIITHAIKLLVSILSILLVRRSLLLPLLLISSCCRNQKTLYCTGCGRLKALHSSRQIENKTVKLCYFKSQQLITIPIFIGSRHFYYAVINKHVINLSPFHSWNCCGSSQTLFFKRVCITMQSHKIKIVIYENDNFCRKRNPLHLICNNILLQYSQISRFHKTCKLLCLHLQMPALIRNKTHQAPN